MEGGCHAAFVILSIAKNLIHFANRLYKILRYATNDIIKSVVPSQ